MEDAKIKINVYRGLDIIEDMIKTTAICREAGKDSKWLYPKRIKRTINQAQLDIINFAIWRIANRLASLKIKYTDDRQYVIDQINEKLDDVRMPYIYVERMAKNRMWYVNRMRNLQEKVNAVSFTEEEIMEINLITAEIAARLLSIELVCDDTE